jgi:hypothetical protein
MWQRKLAIELKGAKSRDRKAIIERYILRTGYTKEHLYRIAKEHGFKSGRKQRADKGVGVLAEEQIEFVAGTIYKTGRENKGPIMPVENAMEFAIDNGIMARGEITVGGMQRVLRQRQVDKARLNAPTPHVEMRSLHPNHVHEVDVSTCIQYYLSENGLSIMREDEFYKNKFANFKKVDIPLQRYILTDHFSGFMFVYYYLAAGETAENLFDFLCRAWEAKAEVNFPFRGVPFKMLMDGGCRAKAKALGEQLWEGLDIEIIAGLPGNSRRQGSVEQSHNIWEKWFETRLRIDPASTIEELNRKARGFCIWLNATRRHTRTGMPRLNCWLMIKREELRELPERAELQALMNKPVIMKKVFNHKIRFEGQRYDIKHANIPHGTEVKVIRNIWKIKEGIITVSYENQLYEARVIEMLPAELGGFAVNSAIIGEQYKAQPETETQKAVKRMDEIATGSRTPDKKATPFAGLNAFEGFAEKVANITALPKKGTPIEMGREIVSASISITEFLKSLAREIGKIPPAMNKELRSIYGDSIDANEAARVIGQIAGGQWKADDQALKAFNI